MYEHTLARTQSYRRQIQRYMVNTVTNIESVKALKLADIPEMYVPAIEKMTLECNFTSSQLCAMWA